MRDLEALAPHADSAGDAESVLRFAPQAAVHAAALGAHREAAGLYARALRYGDRLTPSERAELLERRAKECFFIDQYEEGIANLEEALQCRRQVGDRLREGEVMHRLSEFMWCPGRTAESERAAREAVALLEQLPPGPELARAHLNLSFVQAAGERRDDAMASAGRALELAERFGDRETSLEARARLASTVGDIAKTEQVMEEALKGSFALAADLLDVLAGMALRQHRHDETRLYLGRGLDLAGGRGIELTRLYLLATKT